MSGEGDGVALTQRELAGLVGVSEEHLSRVLRLARDAGEELPPTVPCPRTGRRRWPADAFVQWWASRPTQLPGRQPALTRARLEAGVADGLDELGIARRHGVTVQSVRRAAARWGVVVPDRWGRAARAVALYEAGLSPSQIAARTGYGLRTVYRYVRDAERGSGPQGDEDG